VKTNSQSEARAVWFRENREIAIQKKSKKEDWAEHQKWTKWI